LTTRYVHVFLLKFTKNKYRVENERRYAESCQTGDKTQMILDFNEHTIEFIINGKSQVLFHLNVETFGSWVYILFGMNYGLKLGNRI